MIRSFNHCAKDNDICSLNLGKRIQGYIKDHNIIKITEISLHLFKFTLYNNSLKLYKNLSIEVKVPLVLKNSNNLT